MRANCVPACLTLAVVLTALHPAAQQRPPETFRSGRDVLTVNASVRDASGRPLTDLQPADFVVRIDGQPRTDVLQRVGRYVADYGEQASALIGVEHYEQRLLTSMKGQPSVRRLVADLLLVKTSDVLGWSGFRDVIEVDGKPVGERQNRLQALFKSGSPDPAEARRIADEGARYNIGPTRRNFNEPTSALFFLMPATQPRFEFTRKGETTLDGVKVLEIGFQEKTHPTLIRTSGGRDVSSEGSIWVVPSDGTVVRTKLAISGFSGLGSSSTIDVTYTRDARLGLWVPATMKERHDGNAQSASAGRGGMGTFASQSVVVATATYQDFKRFEITTGIK